MTTWGFHEGTTRQAHLSWFLDDQEGAIGALCTVMTRHIDSARP
jgi:hypothetical protein